MKKLILVLSLICAAAILQAQTLQTSAKNETGEIIHADGILTMPPGFVVFDQSPLICPTYGVASSDWTPGMVFQPQAAVDFTCSNTCTISSVRWWWFYDNAFLTGWRIIIYDDASCLPSSQVAQWEVTEANAHKELYCSDVYTRWAILPTSFVASGGTTYWIVIQGLNPTAGSPQTFWAGDYGTQYDCPSYFKSDYFGYPGWTQGSSVWGSNTECFFQLYTAGQVPLSNWPIYIGIFLVLVFTVIRFRKVL